MSECLAESVVRMENGMLWAVTIQTTDDEEAFEVESQIRWPEDPEWCSTGLIGPYKSYDGAKKAASVTYPEHRFN